MNQKLKEHLKEGEIVCWESQPANFSVLDGSTKKSYIMKVVVAIIIAGGVILGHLSSGGEPRMGLIALAVAAAVAVAVSPFWQKSHLMKYHYWITDQRVIVMGGDRIARFMELCEIDAYKVVADGKAKNCLVLGSNVFHDAEKNIRWRAGNPKVNEEAGGNKSHALGLILYNAERVEEAVQLLKEHGCAKAA